MWSMLTIISFKISLACNGHIYHTSTNYLISIYYFKNVLYLFSNINSNKLSTASHTGKYQPLFHFQVEEMYVYLCACWLWIFIVYFSWNFEWMNNMTSKRYNTLLSYLCGFMFGQNKFMTLGFMTSSTTKG